MKYKNKHTDEVVTKTDKGNYKSESEEKEYNSWSIEDSCDWDMLNKNINIPFSHESKVDIKVFNEDNTTIGYIAGTQKASSTNFYSKDAPLLSINDVNFVLESVAPSNSINGYIFNKSILEKLETYVKKYKIKQEQ